MEEKQKKKTIELSVGTATCLVIIILVLVLLIIAGMYIWFHKKANTEQDATIVDITSDNSEGETNSFAQKENNNVRNITNQKETTSETVKTIKLDLTSELVQDLYKKVLKYDNTEESFAWQEGVEKVSFYKDHKTTYETLNNMEKVITVLKNYDPDRVKMVNKTEVKDLLENRGFSNSYEVIEQIKVYENIEEIAKQVFGRSDGILWESYKGLGCNLEYANGNYYVIETPGGGMGATEFAYTELQSAEQTGDMIYLYDTFLWVNEKESMLNNGKTKFYTTSSETEEMNLEDTVVSDDLIQKYANRLKTYQHVFQKSADGQYEWVSTEIIKK